jgi:outer membrane receptor for ferrienterochelin and colicin
MPEVKPMHARYVLWIAGGLLLASALALSGTTGKISGTVKDAQSGEALVGVNIVVRGTAMGAASNPDGYYVILNVPPGKYTVDASAVGYTKSSVVDVSVAIDLTTNIDFKLATAVVELGHEIVVTAERPAVKKDLTSSEARVDAAQIASLPVTEVHDVISLQSGVTVDRGGAIHIRGGRASEVAYWVDGVSVSDVYDGGQAVQVDNHSVQELQVISGTFNAEYGQAMSGIVNVVTKTGGRQFHGNLSVYSGDYITGDGGTNNNRTTVFNPIVAPDFLPADKIYYDLNTYRPFDTKNIEGSLSGPVTEEGALTFYLSGRYFKSNGWLYGNRIFNTDGSIDTLGAHLEPNPNGGSPLAVVGDNPVPMNDRTRYSGQAKLSYQIGTLGNLSLTALGSRIDYHDFNNSYRIEPEADVTKYDRGYNITSKWTQTLSGTSYYEVLASFFYKGYKEYLYENPLDPRYIVNPTLFPTQQYEFNYGGTNNHHFNRSTETRDLKFDYDNQISKLHELKIGAEGRLHRLYLEDYTLIPDPADQNLPSIPGPTTPEYQQYTEKPVEFSAYAQDKLEYDRMIVNVGLRYDYFNSKGNVLSDPQDPNLYLPQKPEHQAMTLEERQAIWYHKASAKSLLSPRFGISYPITDRGILHFSYGHFLQIPSFINLYQNPEYKVSTASGIQGVYGNPDLDAQKTAMYEFGLQQQLSDVLSFDVTAFYKDTRNWVTTSPPIPVRDPTGQTNTTSYVMYINRDYSNSRGVTITVTRRPYKLVSFNLSYTYQVAEGDNSNPDDAYAAAIANQSPAIALTPLDWDQTHTVNLTAGVGQDDWGAFAIGTYGSGLPYTPVVNQAETQGRDVSSAVRTNSRRQPATYKLDLRVFKNVRIAAVNLSFFAKVFNVFDRRNEQTVYGQTGTASATPANLGVEGISPQGRVNSVEQYINRPDYYTEPREIQIGAELEF